VVESDWFLTIHCGMDDEAFRWSLRGMDPLDDEFLIPAGTGKVKVINTGLVDTTAPVLISFTGLPSALDLSAGPAEVALTVAVEDTGGGFENASIIAYAPESFSTILYLGFLNASTRISGDANSGVYQIPYTFDALVPAGDYIVEITLSDRSGNVRTYIAGDSAWASPFPPGSNGSVAISKSSAGYAGWASGQDFGPDGLDGPLEDANADGVENLLTYAFNMAPNGPSARAMLPGVGEVSGLPAVSMVGEGAERRLRVEFIRRISDAHQLDYMVQFGSDLGTAMDDFPGPFEVTAIDADWQRVVAYDPVAGASERFGRVRVELSTGE
jgi:hypothetical protein